MRSIFFLSQPGYASAWQATSLAITAAAMGDEVVVVLGFDALRALGEGQFGHATTVAETAAVERGKKIGAATPEQMLGELAALGARVMACSTTARLEGLEGERLKGVEVLGLPEIWRLTDGARVLTF